MNPHQDKNLWNIGIRGAACAVVAVGMLFCAGDGGATTMVPTNIAQLSETAESAFVVRVESVKTSVTAAGRAFDTIRGTVVEPVFGSLQTSQPVSWNQFRLGRNVALPGMPQYEIGKEYLIFLTGKGPGTGFQSPVGLGQGAFVVTRNPKTGAAMVRNAYLNSALSAGLDVDKAAAEMVARDPQTKSLAGQQRAQEVQKAKLQLQGRASKDLQSIKKAAQFFHQKKKEGRTPSVDYRTTAPTRVVR